jgi:hypothetical protein
MVSLIDYEQRVHARHAYYNIVRGETLHGHPKVFPASILLGGSTIDKTSCCRRGVEMTKDEKKHLDLLSQLGCVVCAKLGYGETPAEIHHLRIKSRGIGLKASHYDTVPLCPEHHRGQSGVHGMGTKGFAKHYGFDESDLLETTKILLEQLKKSKIGG